MIGHDSAYFAAAGWYWPNNVPNHEFRTSVYSIIGPNGLRSLENEIMLNSVLAGPSQS
jgi:hypothetical protein